MSDSYSDVSFLKDIKVGDVVRRMLAGTIPMDVRVVKVDNDLIYVSPVELSDWAPEDCWTFQRELGYEIDEELFGPPVEDENGKVQIIVISFLSELVKAA